jgi:hypothetical protein
MGKSLFLAIGAGLASAVLSLSVLSGSPLGLPLAYLAPLPLFLVALSQGHMSAATAATCGAVAIAGLINPIVGAAFFLTTGLAPIILSRQALLWREGSDGARHWYPIGRVLTVLALMTGIAFLIALALFAGEDGGLPGAVERQLIEAVAQFKTMAAESKDQVLSDAIETLRASTSDASRILPGTLALSWMLSVMLNGILAQSILSRSERNFRPTPVYGDMQLPRALSYGGAVALVISFVPGVIGFAAGTLAAILIWPYFILGLIVIHVVSRRFSARFMLLASIYLILLMLAWPAALVAGLGLMDQWTELRRQYGRPSGDQEKE